MSISAHIAQAIIDHTEAKAREMGLVAIIAILDDGGHLKAFHRMDGAVLGSIDIAIRKARTAVLFERNSEDVWGYLNPGAPGAHCGLTEDCLAPYAGGIALKGSDGGMAGGLGIAGGTIEQDTKIARAGLAAFEANIR
jgi:uncharacterized protein GlcG (DUF336 family)